MRRRSGLILLALLIAVTAVLFHRSRQDPRRASTRSTAATRSAEPTSLPAEQDFRVPLVESLGPELLPPVDLDAADRDLDLFGRVIDAEGAPVAGAQVECIHHPGRRTTVLDMEDYHRAIVDATTRSASDGTFAIRLARGDLRELRVTHPDFAETCVPGCQAGERVEVVLHPGARLEIRAVDEAGAPVAAVQGRLWYRTEPSPSGERRFATDAAGIAELLSLAPGRVLIDLDHPVIGSPEWQHLELAAGEALVHEVVMPAGLPITGTVRDRATGRPIAGARVGEGWTMERAVLTDARGDYLLVGFSRKGAHDLHAEAEGYGREQVGVPESNAGPIDFEMERGDVAIGQVVDGSGDPVVGIRVHVFGYSYAGDVERIETRRATTGSDGRFRIESLHPDLPHAVVIEAPRHGRVRHEVGRSIRGPSGEIDLGTIELPPARMLEGELVDAEGTSMPGTVVELQRRRNGGRDWLGSYGREEERRTDDLGRFRFPDLAPGEYRLTVRLRGEMGVEKTVRIAESDSETVFVRLALAGGAAMQVEVLYPDGRPVEYASVEANRGRTGSRIFQRTDAEGIARLDGLRGRVRVRVHAPHGYVAPDPIELEPRGQTERFVISPAAYVRGVVVTPEGEPIAGMNLQCRLRRPDGVEGGEAINTESDGTFELAMHPGTVIDIRCSGDRRETLPDGTWRSTWIPRIGALSGVVAPADDLRLVLPEVATDRTLDVLVVGPSGEPIEGLLIHPSVAGGIGGELGPVRSDAEGRAHLTGLPAVEVTVFHSLPAAPPKSGGDAWGYPDPLEVIPSGQEVTIALHVGTRLIGTVVDAEGALIERGHVWCDLSSGRSIRNPVTRGRFDLVLLEGETAEIVIEAEPEGTFLTSGKLEVQAGERERRFVLREE